MSEWHHSPHASAAARQFEMDDRARTIVLLRERVLPQIRAAARSYGWAVTEHGSFVRDWDLVAIPWTDDAVEPTRLVDVVMTAVRMSTGWGYLVGDGKPEAWKTKPHGRVAVTIMACGGANIDLSIMPLARKPAEEVTG